MCHSQVYRGSGVSEHKFISLSQPETPVHYCLVCGCKLTPGKHPTQPNQHSSSKWKRVLACTGCGMVYNYREFGVKPKMEAVA